MSIGCEKRRPIRLAPQRIRISYVPTDADFH